MNATLTAKWIVYDGLNLGLAHGTGIATYARVLTEVASAAGHRVGVVYSSPQTPARNPLAREIAFFDTPQAIKSAPIRTAIDFAMDQLRYWFPIHPRPVPLSGAVVTKQFSAGMPRQDQVFVARHLFRNAERHFMQTGNFTTLRLDRKPDIFHCTYQLPLRVKSSCNIYTIHDLVPLRLPFTTLDNKRYMLRLLRKIAAEADHIITVSDHSKRDIIELLGVDEHRVTNTYQAVSFPARYTERSEADIAEQLEGSFRVTLNEYLLFFGALEPKKNVTRLVEAYLSSGVNIPLVIVAGGGWQSDADHRLLAYLQAQERLPRTVRRRIHRLDYAPTDILIALIRGARAVVFPSLYEGFGLPVLEAMALGTPVITSNESSLPEVAGEAALLVDPYDTDAIARAISVMVADADMRSELVKRGKRQAAKFSVDRYYQRINQLYASLC